MRPEPIEVGASIELGPARVELVRGRSGGAGCTKCMPAKCKLRYPARICGRLITDTRMERRFYACMIQWLDRLRCLAFSLKEHRELL